MLATVTDLLLLQFYFAFSGKSYGKTSRGAYASIEEAQKNLEKLNYQTLKAALVNLNRKGWVRSLQEPIITNEGKKRLKATLPQYQTDREWDKVAYLITYDIPETKRWLRDKLRIMLMKLGAGCLQRSVWLTPYNPQVILKEFCQKPGFEGEIIVSCIGKDGYIGNDSLKSLINRVYNLDELNREYLAFIRMFKAGVKGEDKWTTIVSYLSILKRDPQLPFELLPDNWAGGAANKIYADLTKGSG